MSTTGQKRTNRCITATDDEWQTVTEMARVVGMPITRFVLERALASAANGSWTEQSLLPESAQWDQLRAILTLMRIAEENMERRGETDRLDAIRTEVEERISAWKLGF